jgi:hypothetical protein
MVVPNLTGMTNSAVAANDFAGTLAVEIEHNLLDRWSRRFKHVLDLLGPWLADCLPPAASESDREHREWRRNYR